jgi:hypothetical protein
MARDRHYRREYQRRLAKGLAEGRSRAQARGHARRGESPVRARKNKAADPKLETALREMRRLGSQAAGAKAAGVSPERLRRFLYDNALAERRGREWHFTDDRPRWMMVISDGDVRELPLRGFDQASFNGEHLNAVKLFLTSNDADFLVPFEGRSVIDIRGRAHLLETDPNALYRLAAAGSEVFHDVYRLVQ